MFYDSNQYFGVVRRDDVDTFHLSKTLEFLFAIHCPDIDFQTELLCFRCPIGILVEDTLVIIDASPA